MARSSGLRSAMRRSHSPGCAGVVFAAQLAQRARGSSPAGRRRSCRPSMSKTTILRSCGRPLAHLQRLVELLVVLDEQVAPSPSPHRYSTCAGGVGRVDAVRHAAGAEHAEVGVHPFDDGVGEDRGALRPAAKPSDARPMPISRAMRPSSSQVTACQMPSSFWRSAVLPARVRDAVPEHLRHGVDRRSPPAAHRHGFFFFQRRSPRTPCSFMPR